MLFCMFVVVSCGHCHELNDALCSACVDAFFINKSIFFRNSFADDELIL